MEILYENKTYNKILIVTGGSTDKELLLRYIGSGEYQYIIGVDKGLDALHDMDIIPNKAIGDFDSATERIRAIYRDSSDAIILQPEKDYTDTHVAVEYAMKLGAREITIFGGTGTRLDHVMGNIALLSLCRSKGVEAALVDKTNRIRIIDNSISISKDMQYGKYVSLIPYTDKVTDICLKGFKYELEGYTLIKDETIGISNEIREEEGLISIGEGKLLVLETKD